jgi:hypothetical protein
MDPPSRAPGPQHHHPAARQESLFWNGSEPDPEGHGGRRSSTAGAAARQGSDSGAVPQYRRVGPGDLRCASGCTRLFRCVCRLSLTRTGGGAGGDAPTPPDVESGQESTSHALEAEPHPGKAPSIPRGAAGAFASSGRRDSRAPARAPPRAGDADARHPVPRHRSATGHARAGSIGSAPPAISPLAATRETTRDRGAPDHGRRRGPTASP